MENKKGRALALDLMDSLLEGKTKPKGDPQGSDVTPPLTQNEDENLIIELNEELENSRQALDEGTLVLSPKKKPKPEDPPGTSTIEAKTIAQRSTRERPTNEGSTNDGASTNYGSSINDRSINDRSINDGSINDRSINDRSINQRMSRDRIGSLEGVESLRLAQERILDLERELDRLRRENEELAAAGETFQRRSDELQSRVDYLERQYVEVRSIADEERKVLQNALVNKDAELTRLKVKIEELEIRLATNVQKIRVRERELENRLELAKRESTALVRNKDEIILELKRQSDQLQLEIENYRSKTLELNRAMNEKQELIRKTVRALRLSLSILESEDEQLMQMKKGKS